MHLPTLTSRWLGLLGLTAGLATGLCAQPSAPDAPDPAIVRTSLSFAYLVGDYGLADDTTVLAAIAMSEYDAATWRVRGTVPSMVIDGPASVGSSGPVGPRPDASSEAGLGDLQLEATWKLLPPASVRGLELTGRVKLPTADEDRGLGTGVTDTFVQLDYRQPLGKDVLMVNAGWQFLGDSAAYPLRDGPFAGLTVARPLAGGTTVGLGANWRAAVTSGADEALEGLVFITRETGDGWRTTGFVLAGFTDASPDFGVGLSITRAF